MNRFRERFGKRAFLPVIHLLSTDQAIEMSGVALEAGADGVFLINHGDMEDRQIPQLSTAIRAEFPGLWIGVNFLSLSIINAMRMIPLDFNGLWTDNSEIDERLAPGVSQAIPQEMLDIRESRHWEGIYFGGTAFKYQRNVEDLETAAQYATRYMDVVTTSGRGTGIAADVEKIKRMKKALCTDEFEDYPLAVASGITPENVEHYLPYVDAYLVATGICQNQGTDNDFFWFDPDKVRRLADKIKGYEKKGV